MAIGLIGLTPEQIAEAAARGEQCDKLASETHRLSFTVDGLTTATLKNVARANGLSIANFAGRLIETGLERAVSSTNPTPFTSDVSLALHEPMVNAVEEARKKLFPPPSRATRIVNAVLRDLADQRLKESRPNVSVELCAHLATGEILRVVDLMPKAEDMVQVTGETADGDQRQISMPVEAFQYEFATVEWAKPDDSAVH